MKALITRRGVLLSVAAIAVLTVVAWLFWTERHPEHERELRILAQERLEDWFPGQMALPDELIGFVPRSAIFADQHRPDVVMVHGLDEPGGIWDELSAALDEAGVNGWEFRYPNDQAIDHSADLLAEYWPELDAGRPVVLVGHSMGGLVIRDFVSRRRHPVDAPPAAGGPPVRGVILVATPNHGTPWARLRVWLEVRERFVDVLEGRFSLFAGLRDGTGAAKIDLRPDSAFIVELKARAWPEVVPVRIVGGRLAEPTPAMADSIQALSEQLGGGESDVVAGIVEEWWAAMTEGLGDGVVPIESLGLPGVPDPLILDASHRGLLERTLVTDEQPPAIATVVDIIECWAPQVE